MHALRPAAFAAALLLASSAVAQDTASEAEETAEETGAATAAAQDVTADTVVATVNGTEITVGHMIAAQSRLPEEYQQLPDPALFAGLLDQLVQQEALRSGRETLEKRSELVLDNERRSLQVSEIIREAIDAAVTDEAIEAAYAARYANADPEDEFNAAHILVETEEEARAIIEQIEGGADFATLAEEKSTGPSGPSGGSLGWFSEGAMVPEFEAAVMALEPGAISEPVQTQFGWHVVRLNEVRKKDIPALDDVRNEIIQQIQTEAIETTLASATAEAEITRMEPGEIDPTVIRDLSLLEN